MNWKVGMNLAGKICCGKLFALLLLIAVVLSSCGSEIQGTWLMRVNSLPVLDLLFDPNGTVWLATAYKGLWFMDNQGALRKVENTIAGPLTISELAADREGNLWIRSEEGEIKVLNQMHWQDFELPPELAGAKVVAMFVDSAGNKWFSSNEKIARFEGGVWRIIALPDKIVESDRDEVKTVFVTPEHHVVWIGTDGGKVWSYIARTWTEHKLLPDTDVGPINAFYQDPSGRIWAGTGSGVFSREREEWVYHGSPWGKRPSGSILTILMDEVGRVWVGGSEGIGMLSSDGKDWVYAEEQSQMLGNYVADIEMNKDGTLWFAGFSGVLQLTPARRREVVASIPESEP